MKIGEAIEGLRSFLRQMTANRQLLRQLEAQLEAQQVWIDELEAELKEERRWIPVGERLPEVVHCDAGTAYSEAVNVLTNGRKVLTAIWNGSCFLCDADYWEAWDEKITHWAPVILPLPEPPEVDG